MINPGPPYPLLNGQPPAYPNQIIPPPSTVIFINNGNNNDSNATYCRQCKTKTENIPRRKVGRVTIVWSFVLAFIGLPCCLCCIPFCNDDCKDLEVVCMVCDGVKETIQAQCCWFASLIFIISSLCWVLKNGIKLPLNQKKFNSLLFYFFFNLIYFKLVKLSISKNNLNYILHRKY